MKKLIIISALLLFTVGYSQPKKDDLAHISGMMAVHSTTYVSCNVVLDSYARDLDYEDFDELVRETSKIKLKEHFLLIIKSLRK